MFIAFFVSLFSFSFFSYSQEQFANRLPKAPRWRGSLHPHFDYMKGISMTHRLRIFDLIRSPRALWLLLTMSVLIAGAVHVPLSAMDGAIVPVMPAGLTIPHKNLLELAQMWSAAAPGIMADEACLQVELTTFMRAYVDSESRKGAIFFRVIDELSPQLSIALRTGTFPDFDRLFSCYVHDFYSKCVKREIHDDLHQKIRALDLASLVRARNKGMACTINEKPLHDFFGWLNAQILKKGGNNRQHGINEVCSSENGCRLLAVVLDRYDSYCQNPASFSGEKGDDQIFFLVESQDIVVAKDFCDALRYWFNVLSHPADAAENAKKKDKMKVFFETFFSAAKRTIDLLEPSAPQRAPVHAVPPVTLPSVQQRRGAPAQISHPAAKSSAAKSRAASRMHGQVASAPSAPADPLAMLLQGPAVGAIAAPHRPPVQAVLPLVPPVAVPPQAAPASIDQQALIAELIRQNDAMHARIAALERRQAGASAVQPVAVKRERPAQTFQGHLSSAAQRRRVEGAPKQIPSTRPVKVEGAGSETESETETDSD